MTEPPPTPTPAPLILLDGAIGTELGARDFDLVPPLFSARALLEAPELLAAVHYDYLRAGAQVLTTNSFGLHARTLAAAGIAEQQRALAYRAVEILTHVRHQARVDEPELARFRIAGSIPPRPRGEPSDPAVAVAEYRSYAESLAAAGVDLLLLETFGSLPEVQFALTGVAELGLPVWLSIVAGAPGADGLDGARLIGGDPIAALGSTGVVERVDALMINCTQIDAVPAAIRALLAATDGHPELPLGLLPHFGKRRWDGVWIDRIIESELFAAQLRAWLSPGPCRRFQLVGACCGSKPRDIAALRAQLHHDDATRERGWTRLAELIP